MSSTHDVITRLTHEFPEFQTMLEEHLEDNFGELLPFLFLSDIARWAVEQGGSANPRVTQLLATLETEFAQGDKPTRDLIGVSFVEVLPPRSDPGGQIVNRLGPQPTQVATDMNLFR